MGALRLRRPLLALTFAALAALPLWSLWLEPSSLRNEDYALALPGWPAACDGLTLAVLADLHVGSPWYGPARLREWWR